MKVHIKMTYEEFVKQFKQDVRECNKIPVIYWNLSLKDEFRGAISGDQFWLQKTMPHIAVSGFHRHFAGKIKQTDDGIEIYGKNTYGLRSRICLFASLAALTCYFLFNSYKSSLPFPFAIMLGVYCFFIVLEIIRNLIYRNEDRAAIKYIEGLIDEYGGKDLSNN